MVSLRWSFGQTWVILGILMFLYSFLTGSLYLSPQMRKVKAVVAREGATPTRSRCSRTASSWRRASSWCS